MTTKRELERLARKALGKGAMIHEYFDTADAWCTKQSVSVRHDDDDTRSEMLAAALRGIIAWKEGKR